MRTFIAFVHKETLHILRDRRTLLIVLLLPIVQIVLFGFAISTEITNLRVKVLAERHLTDVDRLVTRLDANPYFSYAGRIQDPADIDRCLRRDEADAVLVVDRKGRMQLVVDASNPNNATVAAGYVGGALGGGGTDIRMLYNPQLLSSYNFVPGLMGLIFVIICALLTSVAIVREKEAGSIELLLVSPVSPLVTVVAKMTPYFAVSCLNLATILLLARYALGVPLAGHAAGTVALTLLYIVLSLAIGLLISTLVRTQIAAMILTVVSMMLPGMLLSGMIFPLENIPAALRWVSAFVPTRWYIGAVRKVMIEGLPLRQVWVEVTVLSGMTVLLMGLALKKLNKRLD